MNSKSLTHLVDYRRGSPGLPLAFALVSLALGQISPGSAQGASFQFTGSMTAPRQYHTATLLPNGQVLVTGGWDGTNFLASAELFDPASGTWSLTSSMGFTRAWHTATLLPSGKVLITGGYDLSNALATEEIYDPATGLWSAIAPMATKRSSGHTASLLPSGQVLVAGGFDGINDLSTAELYDPVSGTWSPAASMTTPRDSHTATSLPNGQVLVVGSYQGPGRITAEIYDPVTDTWMVTADLRAPRSDHTATLLPNGLVLVAGGSFIDVFGGYSSLNYAELYDPATGAWADTAPMVHRRYGHAATLLANGLVLVTGGTEFVGFDGIGTLSISELYDPGAATWREAQTMRGGREYHSATMLANGEVLIAGGGYWPIPHRISSAELYDPRPNPDGGTWSPTGSMSIPRWGHTATLLPSGRVLVAGGADASAEIYDPTTGTWTPTGSMNVPRAWHTATLLINGKVLVVGGEARPTVLDNAEIYDPISETWAVTGAMATPHAGHTATLLFNGKVLVASGNDDTTGQPASSEVYDPASGLWSAIAPMATKRRRGHTASLLPSGQVLVAGGFNGANDLSTAELYDPVSGAWAPTGSMRRQRNGCTATLLPNGKVFVIGGTDPQYPSRAAELYDPATGSWLDTSPRQDGGFEFPATLLRNGTVLVAGGNNETAITQLPQIGREVFSVAEVYEPGTDTWSEVAFMTSPRTLHTATLLSDGRVLVAGGVWEMDIPVLFTVMVSSSAELYQPGGNTNPVPVRPKLISSTLADGAFGFRFVSLPLTSFTVLATTNASVPVSDWTVLGGVTEFAPGLYQFTDANASNYPQRYYRVRSP